MILSHGNFVFCIIQKNNLANASLSFAKKDYVILYLKMNIYGLNYEQWDKIQFTEDIQ